MRGSINFHTSSEEDAEDQSRPPPNPELEASLTEFHDELMNHCRYNILTVHDLHLHFTNYMQGKWYFPATCNQYKMGLFGAFFHLVSIMVFVDVDAYHVP